MAGISSSGGWKRAIGRVADGINARRRQELIQTFKNKDGFISALQEIKKYADGTGKGKAHWRLHAAFPQVVDDFFTAMYGKYYYKDKDFFKKHYPEWLAIDGAKL